ncbi:MAG: hypothetical protein ABWX92_09610 [Mycetocola sp.]
MHTLSSLILTAFCVAVLAITIAAGTVSTLAASTSTTNVSIEAGKFRP